MSFAARSRDKLQEVPVCSLREEAETPVLTWASLPPGVRQVAERELTSKQLEAWKLHLAGWGMIKIARHLGVTKGAISDRLHNAETKLLNERVRMDEFGQWTISEEVAA